MKQQLGTAALFFTAALMAGCGSNGNMSMSTPSIKTSVSGKVADGYLVNATVFLDKNGNYQPDTGEPATITDANGAYSLTVDQSDVGRYPIVALATKGVTIDKDTDQTVANSYLLSIPATAISGTVNSNFISPISTQVREMMETGIYATPQQAMDAMRIKMGLPGGTNLMADYMATNSTAMHTTARNMASLMGNQMSQVMSNNSSTAPVNVERYRAMIGSIFSNLSTVKLPNPPMATMMGNMTAALANIPATATGMPYRNMSSSFRGMMGGTNGMPGNMMGR